MHKRRWTRAKFQSHLSQQNQQSFAFINMIQFNTVLDHLFLLLVRTFPLIFHLWVAFFLSLLHYVLYFIADTDVWIYIIILKDQEKKEWDCSMCAKFSEVLNSTRFIFCPAASAGPHLTLKLLNYDWINQALVSFCPKYCYVYSNSLKYLALHSSIYSLIHVIFHFVLYIPLVCSKKKKWKQQNSNSKIPFFRYVGWWRRRWWCRCVYVCLFETWDLGFFNA